MCGRRYNPRNGLVINATEIRKHQSVLLQLNTQITKPYPRFDCNNASIAREGQDSTEVIETNQPRGGAGQIRRGVAAAHRHNATTAPAGQGDHFLDFSNGFRLNVELW